MTSLNFCASSVSAKSFTRSSGKLSDVIERVRIGVSAGLTLLYLGGFGRFAGTNPLATLIAACTSCAATSIGRSRTNWSVIVEVPNELVEFIEDNPLIWPNCRSSGVVIDETITSALAPGYCVVTWIVGKSTVGRAEIGRSL